MIRKSQSWLVPGVVAGTFVPMVVLAELAYLHKLGANPISIALNQLGFVALLLLLASLACTPIKIVSGWKWPIKIRKALGFMGFVYAMLHFLVYVSIDKFFNLQTIIQDITKRPFIIIGFIALLLLIPLAATSTKRAPKKLGKNWVRLHRLAYVIAPLVIVHFYMRLKAGKEQPLIYGAVLGVFFISRIVSVALKRKDQPAWNGYRKFRISRKVSESDLVTSFYLIPQDGKKLKGFRVGQYLTFRIEDASLPTQPLIRCYSLSMRPDPSMLRVSIKRVRDGIGSNYFHDRLHEGDVIDVKAPSGKFVLHPPKRPVVLIAGGIGVTPILAMLEELALARTNQNIYFFYGTRNGADSPFLDRLKELILSCKNAQLHICYSEPSEADIHGVDYHHHGRVHFDLLQAKIPLLHADYYVCGPAAMMAQLKEELLRAGVGADHFHMEAFGSASVKKAASVHATAEKFAVTFELSGKTVAWDPQCSNILEFAERNGVSLDYGCRAGNCGTCEVKINSGDVVYEIESGAAPGDGACLTCITLPASDLSLEA